MAIPLWGLALLAAAAVGFVLGRRGDAAQGREASREEAYVRLLEHAAIAANEATTLDEAMRDSVERICRATGWPVGRIHVAEAEGTLQPSGDVVLGGSEALPPECVRALDVLLEDGETLAERARRSGRPEAVYDLPSRQPPGAESRAQLLRAAFAVPVVSHGRVTSVLQFGVRQRMEPDPRLLEILSLVGVQIGRVAERAAVQQKFRQRQKLEAIGRLSAGVAHEINNPLAFAYSNLNQLVGEWHKLRAQLEQAGGGSELATSAEECEELLGEAREGIERTVSIVRDMTAFSRVGDDRREPADLREIVDTALRMASASAPAEVTIHRHHAEELPLVSCASSQLKQVLVNLIVNAIEAAAPRGWVGVTTQLESGRIVVEVEDTGPGMSAEIQERIFDPFFTTKQAGEGMGLGLAISYEIVRNHGGEIRVMSAPGAGTVIEVSLPL